MPKAEPLTPSARRMLNVARIAHDVACRVLPPYSHRFSPKKFTQPQLAACVILKIYFRQDYRGICGLLELMPAVRALLGLTRTPHYSTLAYFAQRTLDQQLLARMLAQTVAVAKSGGGGGGGSRGGKPVSVDLAVDSTGMAPTSASAHFMARCGRSQRHYVKLSLAVTLRRHLVFAAVADLGPNNDKIQFPLALEHLMETSRTSGWRVDRLLADKGYDAEWIHRVCRQGHAIRSFIDPVIHRKDGQVGGRWRKHSLRWRPKDFGQRWQVESAISGIKRRFGNAIAARRPHTQQAESVLKALVWSIHR